MPYYFLSTILCENGKVLFTIEIFNTQGTLFTNTAHGALKMVKKSLITPDDLAIFHQAMKGIKPLKQKKVKVRLSKPKIEPQKRQKSDEDEEDLAFQEFETLQLVGKEDTLTYKQPGVTDKTLRKLRKGKYNVNAVLDLHGYTVEKAKKATQDFIQACLHRDIDVALIIHGKGHHSEKPVLKNKLNQWLRGVSVVLAFCSAISSQGNRGAIYVLLKRKSEEFKR